MAGPPSPPSSSPPPSQGERIPPCPECGGDRVGPMELTAGQAKAGLWPLGRRRLGAVSRITDLVAYACLGCGSVRAYTQDLAALRKAVEKHPDRFGR